MLRNIPEIFVLLYSVIKKLSSILKCQTIMGNLLVSVMRRGWHKSRCSSVSLRDIIAPNCISYVADSQRFLAVPVPVPVPVPRLGRVSYCHKQKHHIPSSSQLSPLNVSVYRKGVPHLEHVEECPWGSAGPSHGEEWCILGRYAVWLL
jgi:hypothetical protein